MKSGASLFTSSKGEIYPSKGLRISAGNVRQIKLKDVYHSAPLFDGLRDPANLKGKCNDCEFKWLCGGSRARAWAVSGDMFSEEPCCSYFPGAARKVGDASQFGSRGRWNFLRSWKIKLSKSALSSDRILVKTDDPLRAIPFFIALNLFFMPQFRGHF